ncbi:hypothetical protein R2R35_21750 [Anaerocolumna sp. AGMB13020]|uniref:hypothetical protein n=1 Tax=Anaerocolumna sp. AGMB13020 TaxID=3081750 RepID=UPI002954D021|nr:hypothetical protein [Anaerocolumna sp. AGMB13020]WOO36385.1 hypothetical protein R2R35_21750 [Anaerocolumna sp. AGMB13020]
MAQKIIGGFLILISVLGVLGNRGNLAESLPVAILFTMIALVLIIKKPRSNMERDILRLNQETLISAIHCSGLSLPSNTACYIRFENDGFRFSRSGVDFKLTFDKISEMRILSNVRSIRNNRKYADHLSISYLNNDVLHTITFELLNNKSKVRAWIKIFHEDYKLSEVKSFYL